GRPQTVDQPMRLLGRPDVGGEQDEAERIGLGEEGAFVRREHGPGTIEDDRPGRAHLSRRRYGDAVGPAGLQRGADVLRLLLVEWAGLDAVPHAFVTEIDADR